MKKILCLMIGMCLAENVLALTSGECGTNCSYTLDDNGLLTVYPTVEGQTATMNSLAFDGQYTNSAYASSIKSVNIKPGFTSVPQQAFYACHSLKKLQLPEGITTIGWSAFAYSGLKEIEIPGTVTYINCDAFHDDYSLNKIVFNSTNADKIDIGSYQGDFRPLNFGMVVCKDCTVEQTQALKAKLESVKAQIGSVQIYEHADNGDTLIKDINGNYIGGFDIKGNKLDVDLQGRITGIYDSNNVLIQSYAYGSDGSITTYDKNGKLVDIRGKRIFTVEEASSLVTGKNTFTIRYR